MKNMESTTEKSFWWSWNLGGRPKVYLWLWATYHFEPFLHQFILSRPQKWLIGRGWPRPRNAQFCRETARMPAVALTASRSPRVKRGQLQRGFLAAASCISHLQRKAPRGDFDTSLTHMKKAVLKNYCPTSSSFVPQRQQEISYSRKDTKILNSKVSRFTVRFHALLPSDPYILSHPPHCWTTIAHNSEY